MRALTYSFPGKCIELKEKSTCGMYMMPAKDFLGIYMGSSLIRLETLCVFENMNATTELWTFL